MTESLFYTVLEISVSVSVVVLVVLLLTPVLKKRFTAKWRYWVWLLLAVRLLIPLNFHMPQPAVQIPVPQKAVMIQNAAPQTAQNVVTPAPTNQASQPDTAQPVTASELLVAAWVAGAAVFLLSRFTGYFAFLHMVRRWSHPVRELEAREVLQSQKEEMGIRHGLVFLRCKRISSPMMVGFFRPMLLLPETDYPEEELRLILKHELIHWKRHDVWYKLLLCLANAIHWFNPVIWLMVRRAEENTELVCDSEVVKGFGTDYRRRYGETILSSVRKSKIRGATFSTYFYGGAKTLKQRFSNILDIGKKHRGIAAFCAILIGAASVGSLVACDGSNMNLQVSSVPPKSSASSDVTSVVESTVSSKPNSVKEEKPTSSSVTTAYHDVNVTSQTKCGSYGTVFCGSLKSDPKQGVAVVVWNKQNSNAVPQHYLTPQKHGAIKSDVTNTDKSAKEDVFSVTAEDGYTWLFNLYNGFENGHSGTSGTNPTSSKVQAVASNGVNEQSQNGSAWVAYDDRKNDRKLHIRKQDGTGDRVIATDFDEAPCAVGDWVYYFADLDTIKKVRTDGSQKKVVCGTDGIDDLNGSMQVTMNYQNGAIIIRTLQLKSVGDTGPSATPKYYRFDLNKNTVTKVKG